MKALQNDRITPKVNRKSKCINSKSLRLYEQTWKIIGGWPLYGPGGSSDLFMTLRAAGQVTQTLWSLVLPVSWKIHCHSPHSSAIWNIPHFQERNHSTIPVSTSVGRKYREAVILFYILHKLAIIMKWYNVSPISLYASIMHKIGLG